MPTLDEGLVTVNEFYHRYLEGPLPSITLYSDTTYILKNMSTSPIRRNFGNPSTGKYLETANNGE